MLRILLLLIFVTMGQHALQAQGKFTTPETADEKVQKWHQEAMKANRSGNYAKTLEWLEKILDRDPKFVEAYMLTAAINYDRGNLIEAEQYFEQAINLAPRYDDIVYYQIALTELKLEKYEEAAHHFETFLEMKPRSKSLRQRARGHLANARFATQAKNNPVPFDPQPLNSNINTPAYEYLPALTADESKLIYTAKEIKGQEDFYITERKDGVWQKGRPLKALNTPYSEGAQTISADGRLLVFTSCHRRQGYGSCDLFFSEVRNGRWTRPTNLGPTINTQAWESQPSLSSDGRTLYFASTRPDSRGGSDIFVSQRLEDGSWGKPQNLGPVINTSEDEQSPFIHFDNQTLYFKSKGHPGMGEFDLYISRRDTAGEWSVPENLGYPINTSDNESALTISLDGRTAYFDSDRNSENETTDIFRFQLYPEARPQPVTYVKATVREAGTRRPLRANIELMDLDREEIFTTSSTDNDGEFLICLPIGKDYALNVSKTGYLFHSEHFALAESRTVEEPYLLDIELQLVIDQLPDRANRKPKPVVLNNVFFETGSAALQPRSRIELNRLKDLLEENPGMRIQINGHTDNVGSDEDNQQLSKARAKAVRDYLIEQGVAAERLEYKGFGESEPVANNETAEGRQKNRRTEFIVLE